MTTFSVGAEHVYAGPMPCTEPRSDMSKTVTRDGWPEARADVLEALGHLGQLVDSLRGLFGPAVAAPLREALDDVRVLEVDLVDAVIDGEGRLRSEVAEVRQHLNRTQAALTDTQDRVNVTLTRLTAAVIEEATRARRRNRPLASWAVEAIDESHVAARHLLGERIWCWLLDCAAAGEG